MHTHTRWSVVHSTGIVEQGNGKKWNCIFPFLFHFMLVPLLSSLFHFSIKLFRFGIYIGETTHDYHINGIINDHKCSHRETKTKTSKRVNVLGLWWHHKTAESKKLKKRRRNKNQIMESATTYVTTCQTLKCEYELFSNCRTVLPMCMFIICFSLFSFFSRANT